MYYGKLYGKKISANTLAGLKAKASKIANKFNHVIDRMEVALETAARWGTCFNCAHHKDHDFPKCEKNNGSGPCWEVDDDYFQDVNDTDE